MNKQRLAFLAYLLVVCFLLLITIEWIAFKYLDQIGLRQPFLYKGESFNENEKYTSLGFDLVDPLLGWGRSIKDVTKAGYQFPNDCVALKNSNDSLVILITGGSTTDIILHPENWPILLQKKLNENHLPVNVIVAAVGGYNIGQEMLKLIRDGIACHPTVHISYCGANEVEMPGYVSNYEYSAYTNFLGGIITPIFIPNTITALRYYFHTSGLSLLLKREKEMLPSDFFIKNMKLMYGLRVSDSHTFIGILQPVLNSGKYRQPENKFANDYHVKKYQQYYPAMQSFAGSTFYMLNLSNIFDTCTGNVFVDDCHLSDAYQSIIANRVYQELDYRHLLPSL